MAYCANCGIELEKNIERCPLCHFETPKSLKTNEPIESAYPTAINVEDQKQFVFKNKIFYSYTVIVLAAILILLVINGILKPTKPVFIYSIICVAASDVYLFLILGYVKKKRRLYVSLDLLTVGLSMMLDGIDQSLNWSLTFVFPIITALLLIIYFSTKIYKKNNHGSQFIFIPIYISAGLSILLPVIDLTINLNLYNKFSLTWSIISSSVLLSIIGITAGLFYFMPDYIKERIIRIFHV